MRFTIVFLVALIAVASSANVETNFVQLESHPFGSSLLDLVQMNMQANAQTEMKTSDSLDQITKLIATIQTDMLQAKKDGDKEHKEFQEKADNDISNFERVIEQQRSTRKFTQNTLAVQQKSLANYQADLASAQKLLAETNAAIKSADSENVRAIDAQAKKAIELKEAIAACKEANVELAKLGNLNGASFIEVNMVQVKSGMEKVEKVLAMHLPTRLTVFRPIIQALVDMGTNADQKLVKKVMGLISELQQSLESELANSIKIEAIRLADYTKLRADLVNVQRNTEERIGRDEAMIRKLTKNIKQSQQIIAELNITIPANEKLLATRRQEKADNIAAYKKADASRVDELKVIAELSKYFEEKFQKSMSTYMRNRVAKF